MGNPVRHQVSHFSAVNLYTTAKKLSGTNSKYLVPKNVRAVLKGLTYQDEEPAPKTFFFILRSYRSEFCVRMGILLFDAGYLSPWAESASYIPGNPFEMPSNPPLNPLGTSRYRGFSIFPEYYRDSMPGNAFSPLVSEWEPPPTPDIAFSSGVSGSDHEKPHRNPTKPFFVFF